jgi:hypothetical protein
MAEQVRDISSIKGNQRNKINASFPFVMDTPFQTPSTILASSVHGITSSASKEVKTGWKMK